MRKLDNWLYPKSVENIEYQFSLLDGCRFNHFVLAYETETKKVKEYDQQYVYLIFKFQLDW